MVWCGKRALLFIFMMLSSTFTKQLTKVLKDKMKKLMVDTRQQTFLYIYQASAIYYLLAGKKYRSSFTYNFLYTFQVFYELFLQSLKNEF